MKKKKIYSISETKKVLKNKKMLFAFWRAESKLDAGYHNWFLPLKKLFGNIIIFDTSKIYFRHGKESMASQLLDITAREKPDYILFDLVYDEIDITTVLALRKISPNTKMINLYCDDDWRYEDFSRFYAPFFDYSIITQEESEAYKRDGIKNTFFMLGFNCDFLKPLPIKKKYDVTFWGRPRETRKNYLIFLIRNGIDVNIWGDGWAKYPELKNHYHGFLSAEELSKVISESKINLAFTEGGYGKTELKGRAFEVSACNSFVLVEHYEGYKKFLKEGKELVMFKDNEDLIKKIQYYLLNEKKREKIADNAYKRVISSYDQTVKYLEFFQMTLNHEPSSVITSYPKSKKQFLTLSYDELFANPEYLKRKCNDFDYIYFVNKKNKSYNYREFIQAYSMEKSFKNVSCCDYYVSNPYLGKYLLFKSYYSFKKLGTESFSQAASLYQLMFTKEYFIKNLDEIRNFVIMKKSNLLKAETTAFVSIPLLEMCEPPKASYEDMCKFFQMKFLDKLYSLYFHKKLIFDIYPYILFSKSIFQYPFILLNIFENIFDKSKLMKVKRGF